MIARRKPTAPAALNWTPPVMKPALPKYARPLLMGLGFCGALAFGGHELIRHLESVFDFQRLARDAMLDHPTIFAVLGIYIVPLACPFVPGAELGLLLLILFGVDIAGFVYLATITALVLSFSIGRLVPEHVQRMLFLRLRLVRAAEILRDHSGGPERFVREKLVQRTSNRWLRRLLQYRTCALIALINTPGNTPLGGGGGIAMAAGISRLITFREFLLSVSFAVAPVPAALVSATWLAS